MTKKVNIIEALEFYCDNGLEEIISEKPQNYFAQKDVVKKKVIAKTANDFSQKISNSIPEKVEIKTAEKTQISFIKPIFSTSEALSTLAQKSQQNNQDMAIVKKASEVDSVQDSIQDSIQGDQKFISLNEIVAKAKKLAGNAKTLAELRSAIENFDGCNLKKMATNTVFCDGNPNSKVMVIGEAREP